MDAVEFLRERRRMCNAQDDCDTCPIGLVCDDYFVNHNYSQEKASGMVSTVEQWAKEHPAKTRQSEFLKQWPEADVDENGVLQTCPALISASHRDQTGGCATLSNKCENCRKAFWFTEVADA